MTNRLRLTLILPVAILLLIACPKLETASQAQTQSDPVVQDISLLSGLQDHAGFSMLDHLKRGRASIWADFNNDGLVDVYIGNPRDESYILLNQGNGPDGIATFSTANLLLENKLAWGGAAADYDEDGDIDLFISIGGNEGADLDIMFRNMFVETGSLGFVDVTEQTGVAGQILDGDSQASRSASANAIFVDYDRDGDVDLWVNTNETDQLQNVLWENQLRETGVATFENVTDDVGLTVNYAVRTFHSSWADFDRDGDMDLLENNFQSLNRLMKNMLVETGTATFIDNTAAASLPGDNLAYPRTSFGSAVMDFNGDGFDDIFANFRFRPIPGDEPVESPYGNGHAVFLNDGTGKFTNGASNDFKLSFPADGGVMGFMVGDMNGDTFPEIFLGQGGPMIRQENQYFVSDGSLDVNGFPNYVDSSSLINFAAPELAGVPAGFYPTYPYRTHGTSFVDTNGDGSLEIYVANGGRAADDDEVRDPNRHFLFDWGDHNHFTVRLIGDGVNVNRDGIGGRLALTVGSTGSSQTRQIYRAVRAGNAFSAQNDIRAINFGLGTSDVIHSLEVVWSDGTVQNVFSDLAINTHKTVTFGMSEILLGDINQDGVVNLLDIAPFIALISSGNFQLEADINKDGVVNLLDVDPFIGVLSS